MNSGMDRHDHESMAPVDPNLLRVAPSQLGLALEPPVESIGVRMLLGAPVYDVVRPDGTATVYEADTGTLRGSITEAEAREIAQRDRVGRPAVLAVERVDSDPPVEYRGRSLPAWRVALDDGDGTNVWIDATTGAIRARRNDAWRRFDLFWMLHTMDYSGRDDFNTPWLVAFALLGLVTTVSGGVLWALRVRRRGRNA